MKILLTGKPKIGKSTILQKFLDHFTGDLHGVVVLRMIDESGVNQGFQAKILSGGDVQIIAHRSLVNSEIVIGNGHKVDIPAIENFVVQEIDNGIRENVLTVIDEIGRMQAQSSMFLRVVEKLLNSRCPVLGTIVYDNEEFSKPFKKHPSVVLVQVTLENRELLPELLNLIFAKGNELGTLSLNQSRMIRNLLQGYFDNNQFIQIRKLFNNALPYFYDNKVHKKASNYIVIGNTHDHIVLLKKGKYICDCDLFNGRRKFKGKISDCSLFESSLLQAFYLRR